MSIPFTQYLLPRGERTQISIDRAPAVEAQAQAIIAAGMRFEAEMLTDYQTISLTVFSPAAEEDVAIVLVANGPDVPAAVDRLVADAFKLVETCDDCGKTAAEHPGTVHTVRFGLLPCPALVKRDANGMRR